MTDYQLIKAFYVEQLGFKDEWEHRFGPSDSRNDDLGFSNMTVTDPDGNQLRFMERSRRGKDPA